MSEGPAAAVGVAPGFGPAPERPEGSDMLRLVLRTQPRSENRRRLATILADTDSNACDETRSHSHIAPTQGGCAFLRASVRKLNPETCIFDCSRAMEKRNCVESRCFDCMILFKSQFLGPGNFYITFNHEDPITHLPDSDHSWSYSIGSRPLLRPNQRVEAIVQRQRHEGLGTGWTREV